MNLFFIFKRKRAVFVMEYEHRAFASGMRVWFEDRFVRAVIGVHIRSKRWGYGAPRPAARSFE